MKIATGEVSEELEPTPAPSPAQQLGKLGGAARAKALTPERKAEIARKAAAKRWGQKGGDARAAKPSRPRVYKVRNSN